MSHINFHFFVITTGPEAGKTTLPDELERPDFPGWGEIAPQIIHEQVEQGGDALPWSNTAKYTELMLARSAARFLQCLDPSSATRARLGRRAARRHGANCSPRMRMASSSGG
jgi:predicted ATPase